MERAERWSFALRWGLAALAALSFVGDVTYENLQSLLFSAQAKNGLGPDDAGHALTALLGVGTLIGGAVAGLSVAVSRVLRAHGAAAHDRGRAEQARGDGSAAQMTAEAERSVNIALNRVRAEGEREAAVLRARAELLRAERGQPELPPAAAD